ncbi:MAG: hypothetical protein IKN12_00825 [Selenomonadaceae bacterium]|nr:hypothetical protein [Selenomonadaceae bacterium]
MASKLTEGQLAKLAKLSHLKSFAGRVKAITDNLQSQINTLGNDAIKGVQVNGTALTATNNVVNITGGIEKLATAEAGFAASYQLKLNGVAAGDKINIAKDWLLKDVELLTSTASNFETVGTSAAGKKYIDFTFNTKADGDGATETDTHIYLPVEDLVDIYTNGNGLNLVGGEFSIKIDTANANGLSVDAAGLKLGLATADTYENGAKTADGNNGAMSSADKYRLDNISNNANKTTVTTEKAGTIEIDGVEKVIVEIAADADVATMLNEELPAPSNGGGE